LRALDVDNLVLAVHDACFPALPTADSGRGSPYSQGARQFIDFACRLGFTGLQLGPQGQTSLVNPSPYDSTVFSKNILSIDLSPLTDPTGYWAGMLSAQTAQNIVQNAPTPRIDGYPATAYAYLFVAQQQALREAFATFSNGTVAAPSQWPRLRRDFTVFQHRQAHWLEMDALFAALRHKHGTDTWLAWPSQRDQRLGMRSARQSAAGRARIRGLRRRYAREMEYYRFCQFLVHRQHAQWKAQLASQHFKVFGDLQVGYALQDQWAWQDAFLDTYRLGAPPSRTNPAGQPWDYPILHPQQVHSAAQPTPALMLMRLRMRKLLAEFDGLRIDHPHGLVDPWGYRRDTTDPYAAVQQGARIYSSPALPDHPALAAYAIAHQEQINAHLPRHGDHWVRSLHQEQVERYAVILDTMVQTAVAHGWSQQDILCEVLSTLPYPLQRSMERHRMGRFRVTQKAVPEDAGDVYHCENARPQDWVMTGNHDTPPIWRIVRQWATREPQHFSRYAAYLTSQLVPDAAQREHFRQQLLGNPNRLVQAMFAHLFACPARHVMIFFADVLGMEAIYNQPGTVNDDNWHLRVPNDFAALYHQRRIRNQALNMPLVLAMAIRARGAAFAQQHQALLAALDAAATP
jgi:4-alpha-glucanotransferase